MDIDNLNQELDDNLLFDETEGSNDLIQSGYDSSESCDDISGNLFDGDDLKVELQKSCSGCYKSDFSYSSNSCSEINDEDLQASALCQFMDILNDLDEVLDKSLLACLENELQLDSDEDDVVCNTTKVPQSDNGSLLSEEAQSTSTIDNTQVMLEPNIVDFQSCKNISVDSCILEKSSKIGLCRSNSFSGLTLDHRENFAATLERNTYDDIRSSMRQLDPIVLPAVSETPTCEPLTLPVILFLEHNVNMRPTSAPMQLQVTTSNLNSAISSGPLIVGRRTLLMNRTLSSPSPGESDGVDWNRHNTTSSTVRSTSGSSSTSTETLNDTIIPPQLATASIEDRNEEIEEPPFGVWPHRLSSMLACLSCTVGIFNISRFSIFSVHFGANFIVQFFILSFIIGLPIFTLHLCLGQVLSSGPMDMWRISPIFQGVGISLLLTQSVIGMYSIIGLSWIFVYFRDSFITSSDRYKWSFPLDFFGEDAATIKVNSSYKIQDTIPQYFHGEVLQRNLASGNSYFGTIKFQVAFNLAVVWMIVFVSLSKGLRSYGKAVYVLIFLPICGTLVLCTKLLTLIPYDSVTNIFAETEWNEFFINSKSWAAAAQETFLTWGLFGACIMQLTSHKNGKSKSNNMLQKESACIISFTFAVLLLASFLANTCVLILKNNGYLYIPSSFESVKASQFLWPTSEPLPGASSSTPLRYMGHYGSLVGVTVWRVGASSNQISGWQPLQLATQLVPATLATLSPQELSPAWAVIFYFILIMFGIGQQLAIWHCVITGIMAINSKALRIWETTITFLSCVIALIFGLFLTTDAGIRIVHFIDYVWVGAWWHCLLHVALACGVFVVRGRPYTGDIVVTALYAGRSRCVQTLAALLSFTWNVILPVVLIAVCVVDFRISQQRQLYSWRRPAGYWPIWTRQVAVLAQQYALLTVPVAAFIQTWRYMSKGPPDILERIQNLYRPRMDSPSESYSPHGPVISNNEEILLTAESPRAPDPPPKYTPPPSYSTATGARLLNTLRRSFRTLRRITSNLGDASSNDTSQIPITLSESIDNPSHSINDLPPQDYTSVYSTPSVVINDETDSRRNDQRPSCSSSLSLTRDFLRRSFVRRADSAKSIRSSMRRSFKYAGGLTTSHEYLVRGAEPISNTVAMSSMLNSEESPQAHSRASVI